MNGLLNLLFNLGVVLVALWCLQNDSTSLDGPTKGLFAMGKPRQDPAPGAKKLMPAKVRIPRLRQR
jgi:hypothetical protein